MPVNKGFTSLIVSIIYFLLLILNHKDAEGADEEADTSHYHHRGLMVAHQREDGTSTDGCYDLWYTDGTVEQTEIGPHVSVALQGIGDKRKGHRQHRSPATADEQEGDDLQVLIVDERDQAEAKTSDDQAHAIGHLRVAEAWQHHCPGDGAHGLNGIEHTRPVGCLLIGIGGGIDGAPYSL